MVRSYRSPSLSSWRLPAALAAGLVATVAGGCQEEETGVASQELTDDEFDARCKLLARCGFAPDEGSCRDSEEVDRALAQAVGGIPLERVEYDKDAAEAYLALLEETGCEATLANSRALIEARQAIFNGLVDAGDGCFVDEECSGDAICDRFDCPGDLVCCTGTCVENRVLSNGSACTLLTDGRRITDRCEDDAYCAAPPDDGMDGEPAMMGTCNPRVDNGMPCDVNEQCFDGQRCDSGDSGTCFRLSGDGEQCNPMITAGSCVLTNQICDMGSSTCVDAPGPGSPCVFGRCQPYAECREDMCVANPRLGEACDGSIQCLGDLDCRDGVCGRSDVVFICVEGQDPPPPVEEG